MLRQSTTHFGPAEQALARALYEAGQSDTEIGLSIGTSVNNIIDWRKSAQLPEIGAPAAAPVQPTVAPQRPAARPSVTPAPSGDAASLITAGAALDAFKGAVTPQGDNALEIGTELDRPVFIDLEELLATRLLVQGNSGSGKSHLLRRVIEESTGIVQQVVIDPEGDFVGLGNTFGHTVIDAHKFDVGKMAGIGARVREHRGSAILNLEALDAERQMECAAAFLNGMFDAPREHWFPALVFVDEAQLFAPSSAGEEDRETRKASLGAMTNLMCRGRKRGLAGVLATQRLAKLHKNVAAEASNFLMGRTFLDIDIARAADLLGMDRRQAETIRDLSRGEFLGLGPAIARRPIKVTVGSVMTSGPNAGAAGLAPLPNVSAADLASLLLTAEEDEPAPTPVPLLRAVK